MFIWREGTAFVISMRIIGKVVSYTKGRVTLYTTVILFYQVDNWCKQAQFFLAFLLALFVADLTALLFKNLDEFCH